MWNKTSKQDLLGNWVVGWTSYVVSIFVGGVKSACVCFSLLSFVVTRLGTFRLLRAPNCFEHPLISQASATRVFLVGL